MDARIAFSDSNDIDISGGSSSVCCTGQKNNESPNLPANSPADANALGRLSETLESMFLTEASSPPEFDFFADAKLVAPAGNREIPVHRCILSARSPFFRSIFSAGKKETNAKVELREWMKDYNVSFDVIVIVLGYLYSGRVKAWPRDVCVCVDDECSHDACMPVVKFMVEVLYASFIFQVSELVAKFQVIACLLILNLCVHSKQDHILFLQSVSELQKSLYLLHSVIFHPILLVFYAPVCALGYLRLSSYQVSLLARVTIE